MPEVVVADTSPLIYLHRAQIIDLLRQLYGRVLVPPIVVAEVAAGDQGDFDVLRLADYPWIEERAPQGLIPVYPKLHPGEAAAIALAVETGLRVLIDDQAGRHYLRERHHPFTGTLGVLIEAKRCRLVTQVGPLLDAIARHGFWINDAVRHRVLELASEA